MPALRALMHCFAVCLSIVVVSATAGAVDIVDAPFEPVSIDILTIAEKIERTDRETDIESGPDATGAVTAMHLSALSRGPNYRWLVFSVRNAGAIPLDYVIVAKRKSFVGSGIFWPQFGTRILVDAQASPGLPPRMEQTRTADAYSFRVGSNQIVTYALEVAGPWPDNLNLWQRTAFDRKMQQVSFFHGLLLGIATLVAIYVSSLFIIRRKLMFPAAALFTWCGAAFLAVDFGYLPAIADVSLAVESKIRAIVEATMAFSLLVSLYTFVELRKRIPVVGYVALGAIAGCAMLIGYAYAEPAIAAGIARVVIVLIALGGLVIVLSLSRQGVIRAQVAFSAWVLITIWSLLALLAATGIVEHELIGPGMAAGLLLVSLMIAFTVTQYAFDAGVISSRFFEDSGRRALALAGSEQCVWDWREDQGWLYVGQELERPLGLKPGALSAGGLKGWLELMHPGDRPAYVASVEAAIQRGRGNFSQEFRLRRHDGTYRWYQLRARTMPGEQGRASRCIGTLADITTPKRSEERMLYDAVQDRLTGLPNRALFMDRLERAMRRSQADDAVQLFVIVIDIDRFKNVNDGLGHSIGDSLLLTVARRLQKFVGPDDTLARLSGDQYGMIINAAWPERQMHGLTEDMRQHIARPVELTPREVFLTASVGVAEYMRDVLHAPDVLKDAEIALYEAKRRGKNKIEFFRPTMRDDRSKLIEIESELRRALERNEIEVAYQPIFNIATEKLSGFEALVRWRHPKHGVLGPDEFIGIAEETGIIIELGRFVMGEAARQLGIWQRVLRPSEPIFVSVNLSSRQVLDQNLVDDVRAIISREDVARGSLKLELTESLVMENVELSAQVLRKLNDIGVAILCDDFGTGYSSLANLHRFSFDTLKIDRSFIDTDPEDDESMIILEAIIILAHDLGMRVVAEGVEAREQLDRLREFECDFAQGFYFGEPLSPKAVVEALGGQPHMLEPKRPRTPRGFLGKLMRAGVAETPDDHATPSAAEQAEPPGPIVPLAPSAAPEAPPPAPNTQASVRQAPRRDEPERRAPPQKPMAPEAPEPQVQVSRTGPPAAAPDAPPQYRPPVEVTPPPRAASPRQVAPASRPPAAPQPEEKQGWFARLKGGKPQQPEPAPQPPLEAAPRTASAAPAGQTTAAEPLSARDAYAKAHGEVPPAERSPEPVSDRRQTGQQPAGDAPPIDVAGQHEGAEETDQRRSAMERARERMATRPTAPPPPPPNGSESLPEPAASAEQDPVPEAPRQTAPAAAPPPPSASPEISNGAAEQAAVPQQRPMEPAREPVPEPAQAPVEVPAEAPTGSNDIAALARALASARSGMAPKAEDAQTPAPPVAEPSRQPQRTGNGDYPGAQQAAPAAPAPPDEDFELFEHDELAPEGGPDRQLEDLDAGRKRPSKLANLLRRSRKSPTAADP